MIGTTVCALIGDRLEEALRFAERMVVLDSVSWGSYWAVGDTQWRLGRVAEAEAAYRKATELSPTSANTHAWLGMALLRQESRTKRWRRSIAIRTKGGGVGAERSR